MTRVDFYVLANPTVVELTNFVCRLTEKAWRQKHKVVIRCRDKSNAQELNERLWTYRDISFIPHDLIEPNADSNISDKYLAPVAITYDNTEPPSSDILINLGDGVPDFFSRFERVMETTGVDEEQKKLARQRYRFYQERGYALETHKL